MTHSSNQTAGMLPNALAWHGLSANVVDESYPGTGLLDPHMVATQIAKVADHPRADIVVIEFSGNCFNCPVAYGSDEFFKQWLANLAEIVDAVESRGMHVVLVVPPPIRADLTWAAVQHDLGLRTASLALTDHTALANWTEALADSNGNYQQVLSYADLFGEPDVAHGAQRRRRPPHGRRCAPRHGLDRGGAAPVLARAPVIRPGPCSR